MNRLTQTLLTLVTVFGIAFGAPGLSPTAGIAQSPITAAAASSPTPDCKGDYCWDGNKP